MQALKYVLASLLGGLIFTVGLLLFFLFCHMILTVFEDNGFGVLIWTLVFLSGCMTGCVAYYERRKKNENKKDR